MANIYFAKTRFSKTWMVVQVTSVKEIERDDLNILLRQHGTVATRELGSSFLMHNIQREELEKIRHKMEEAGHTLVYQN